MADRIAGTALTIFALATAGCFNPDPVSIDTDADPTESSTGAATTMSSDPSTGSDPSTDPSTDPTTGPTTMGETENPTTIGDTTVTPPECEEDGDCAEMAAECEAAACSAEGLCEVSNAAEGIGCGDASDTQCNGADSCDGRGSCVENVVADGIDCSDCESGQCTCNAGSCGDCVTYADTNLFSTDRSLNGWELTGDWGLYREAPASRSQVDGLLDPAIPFSNQVLGTDGNRNGPAYPGGHMEFSYARTPPTELPTSLEFQSWHLDEGAGTFDNKIIRISTDDGETWTDLISCVLNPALPFCQPVNQRDADDWDAISLDLPAPLIGQVGIIEFSYDTFDACCDFEKGWYIDVTNFATECACAADEVCEAYGTQCGAGVCGGNGGCNVDPVDAGTACGAADDNVCTAVDACDGFGGCHASDNYPPYGSVPGGDVLECDFCAAGDDCVGCAAGACQDCASLPDLETFDSINFPPFQVTSDWDFEAVAGGNWRVFFNIPNNENNDGVLNPSNAPFFGIDGSTFGVPNGAGEVNTATAVTSPDVFGDVLEFRSWHQDEGGAGADRKMIEITVDAGITWIPLVDCSISGELSAFPFCLPLVTGRDAEDWDDISIDTSDYADMEGQIRFFYDTVNSCCGDERGWYIDDLNFSQTCDAPNESTIGVQCNAWLDAALCNDDQACAWDGAAAACIACGSFFDEASCDAEPLCAWRVGEGGSTICAQAPA